MSDQYSLQLGLSW